MKFSYPNSSQLSNVLLISCSRPSLCYTFQLLGSFLKLPETAHYRPLQQDIDNDGFEK